MDCSLRKNIVVLFIGCLKPVTQRSSDYNIFLKKEMTHVIFVIT